jgi:HemY protein
MTRIIFLFLALFVLAAGAAWFADYPGRVVMEWRGWRVETSAAALATAVGILMILAAALARFWRWLRAGPGVLGGARAEARRRRGYQALGEGLVAVAAGDAGQAGRLAKRATALLDEPPLTLLLGAQAAQLGGDEGAAKRSFEAMLARPETEFLGLRGLLAQARREGDDAAALELARRARELRPDAPWVLETLFDLESAAGNWGAAEATLGRAAKLKLVEPEAARRRRALVLLGRVRAEAADGNPALALEAALGAHKAAPELSPATVLAVDLLTESGKGKRAEKLLQEGWRAAPHPDLVAAFERLHQGATAAARLDAFRKIAATRPEDPESRLALAGLALAAEQTDEARRELAALGEAADARAHRLAATLEQRAGNPDAAMAALSRAAAAPPGPAWRCGHCGQTSADWGPRCPACGAFDGLAWSVGAAVTPTPLAMPEPGPPEVAPAPAVSLPEPAPAAEAAVTEESGLPAVPAAGQVPPPPDVPAKSEPADTVPAADTSR